MSRDASRRTQRGRPARPKVPAKCRGCGKVFIPKQKDRNKYCSAECYRRSRSKNAWVERTCEHCGREFRARAIYVDRGAYRFCSKQCRLLGMKKGVPPSLLKVRCKTCGHEFPVKPVEALRGKHRQFCSMECRRKAHGIQTTCEVCGKAMRVTRGSQRRRYCSMSCYRRSRAQTLPEAAVAHFLAEMGIRFRREVSLGRYSVDFVLVDLRAAIEVDEHYWHANRDHHRKNDLILGQGWSLVRLDAAAIIRRGDTAIMRALLASLKARIASLRNTA